MASSRFDALAGEWGSVPSLLEAVSNATAAEAARTDSGTGQRAAEALRRVADAMREDGDALDAAREALSERPQASIHVSVKSGKARLVMPGGSVAFVREGEAIRIWPFYQWREEAA